MYQEAQHPSWRAGPGARRQWDPDRGAAPPRPGAPRPALTPGLLCTQPTNLRPSRRAGPVRHNNPSTIGNLITPGIWPSVLNWDDTVDVRADRYDDWLVWAR